MANPRVDGVDLVTPVTQEGDILTVPPMTVADNTRVAQSRSGNEQQLRESGVLPDLSIASDFTYAYKNFDNLDKSKDGHITKEEIDAFIKSSNELKPEDAAALTRVRDQIERLQEQSNDENGDENDGITRSDLRVAQGNANAMDYARRNFDRLDGNHDGHVTGDELETYAKVKADRLSAEEIANLAVLRKNMSDLEEFSDDETGDENDGFTRHDLMKGEKERGIDNISTGATGDEKPSAFGDLRPALAYAQSNFAKIDADRDGYISKDEIDVYSDNNELTYEEMQNLKALKAKVQNVEDLSNDELGAENNGISRKDIVAANAQIANLAYAQKIFEKIDGNGNRHVTADEIEGYIAAKGSDLPLDELRKLEALKKRVGDLQEKHDDESGDENDGFTVHDVTDAMDELGSAGVEDGRPRADQSQESPDEPPVPIDDQQDPEEEAGPESGEAEKTHTVVRGDSLWKICKGELRQRNGGAEPTNADILKMVKEMTRLNSLADPNLIRPGDILKFPAAVTSSVPEQEVPPMVII